MLWIAFGAMAASNVGGILGLKSYVYNVAALLALKTFWFQDQHHRELS